MLHLRLKREGSGEAPVPLELPAHASLAELRSAAASALGLASSAPLSLLAGFPPRALASADEAAAGSAAAAGARSGQQLLVRVAPAPAAAPPPPAAAPPPPLAAPATPGDGWACAHCTLRNMSSARACAACGGARAEVASAGAPVPPSPTSAADAWACDACTLRNPAGAAVCGACARARPVAAAHAPAPAPSVPSPASAGPAAMVRHVVAADNSCLFHAVSACLASSAQAVDGGAPALRRRVVAHMLARPAEYSAAVLGQPPEAYAAQMLGSAAWGGALECRALAELLAVQLAVADIRTAALFVYCEERAFARRMFLLYDGVHYDALFAASGTRLFGPSDAAAAAAAVEVADALRREHAFTDTAHFSLACSACGILVAGTAEAQAHAEATGHGSFVERRPPAA